MNGNCKTLHRIGLVSIVLIIVALLLLPAGALAQSYYFSVDELTADVFVNEDGTISLEYLFVFSNAPGSHAIDFVDVGMPTSDFSMTGVTAEVDGAPVNVSRSDYQGDGSGFAVVLGSREIPSGGRGQVHVFVPTIQSWLRTDSRDPNYASLVFSPTYFGSEYVQGNTVTTVTFHLPPGVQPEEPRWHEAPSGFPAEPAAGFDDQGRITYTWSNPQAVAYEQYEFGASFPIKYVPAEVVTDPSVTEALGLDTGALATCACFSSIFLFIGGTIYATSRSAGQRKLQYMPPKIAIEGMGIKRGLTAVEAAILMEQPLDKVLTMILFGLVKKDAAQVAKQDPLTVQPNIPAPADLMDYERDFLAAFQKEPQVRRKALQDLIADLVKSVSNKMKGFSRRETVAYYKDIMERAWKQVEAGQTPEVKMEAYDKYMEWTMLDREYDDRTRRTFTGPVVMPNWWPRYDPTYRPMPSSGGAKPSGAPSQSPGGGGGGLSLPNLPGSVFAASVVRGVQDFSSDVMGNVTEFTSAVTNRTNPAPPPTTSYRGSGRSGGSGCACACACACAGCACACAGGGR